MSPAIYNLFESLVRAVTALATDTLKEDRATPLREDAHGKLMALKQALRRGAEEDLSQPTAQLVAALARSSLGYQARKETTDISKKELLRLTQEVARRAKDRAETTEATLHPTGRCTCAGEGTCEWCATHCFECGMALGDSGECPHCYPAGEALAEEVIRDNDEIEHVAFGLDPDRWRLIKDESGSPSVALYFNGDKDSLSQEQVEEIEEAVLPIIRGWGR